MDSNLRKGWTEIITGADLDRHLAEVGQAQANARLLVEMLADSSLHPGAALLLASVGTGQFLDYIDADALAPYRLTCTDINAQFLGAIEARLRKTPQISAAVRLDDIEQTTLAGPFDGAAAILLLEHIEWKQGIASIAELAPTWLYLVIQRNEAKPDVVTVKRDLAPSIRAFQAMASPGLVPESELTGLLAERGYPLHQRYERPVPDNKTMVGLVYRRSAP